MLTAYDKGDALRIHARYTDSLGAPLDPGIVKFSFRTPAGQVTTWTYPTDTGLIRTAPGLYYADVVFTSSGRWAVRHFSEVSGIASAEAEYFVKESAF